MSGEGMRGTVERHLAALLTHEDRHVGGEGNRAATAYFADVMGSLGLTVRTSEMPCFEWLPGEASLESGGRTIPLHVGPYSPPCDLTAPLVAVSTAEELESDVVRGAVVLLHGEIAAEQYMPRNFTFYNPAGHRRVYRALDEFAPAAVVAATGRDPQVVGSQYPFPLFEDGDLDVPNAYLTDAEGEQLLLAAGTTVRLRIDSARRPASAEHVIASLPGTAAGKIVVSAHIDSRRGSPGALDNATGVATMLAVAELLRDYRGTLGVEFVPFNGEDDYANPGELRWIEEHAGRFDEIFLGINVDDSSQVGAGNEVSFYGCTPEVEAAARDVMRGYEQIAEGPQWFQGDHSILSIYGRPAIAIASERLEEFMRLHAHTERDTLELADVALVVHTAEYIADLIRRLSGDR